MRLSGRHHRTETIGNPARLGFANPSRAENDWKPHTVSAQISGTELQGKTKMFIETCLICYGLHAGSKLYKKIRTDNIRRKADHTEGRQSFFAAAEEKYQNFVQRKIDPLFGDPRGKQMKLLSPTEALETSGKEKKANRNMGLASVNMGLAVISRTFFPHLLVTTVPFILFLAMDWFKDAFQSLFRKHRFNIGVLDGTLAAGILLSGYLFAGSLILFVFSLQRKLISKTESISRRKLIEVFGRQPRSVWIMTGTAEVEIPFEDLQAGDIFVMNAGEVIPADGTVEKGMASVDQHALTGESQPAEKEAGDRVFASTLVLSGKIYVLAEKAGQETAAAKIGHILNRTTSHKTSFESETEKFVDWSSLPTVALSGLAYFLVGSSGCLGILFSSLGYNMRIVGPMSTLNFLRIVSRHGVLVKDVRAMERLARVDTLIFDKTGTLTLEQPYIGDIHSCNGFSQETLLTYAAAAEHRQTHPVARAIQAAAEDRGLSLSESDIEEASYKVGYGIRVNISGRLVRVGSERFMETEGIPVPNDMRAVQERCGDRGHSLVMVAIDEEVAGAIELCPTVRPEAKQLIRQLGENGMSACIISGDGETPTRELARELGIDRYFAGILPEEKAEITEKLRKEGKTVCFVGDGINDAIALKKADISVSLRGASTAATDSADIVLMDENLGSLSRLLDISREFRANQRQNMAISVIPGLISTGGVFFLHFGIYASVIIYYLGLGAGLGNAALPLIRHKKEINAAEPDETSRTAS